MAAFIVAIFAYGCSDSVEKEASFSNGASQSEESEFWVDSITELDDSQYPDNPDISIRSRLDGMFSHSKIKIERTGENFNLYILPNNENSDTVFLENIDLKKFIPSVPTHVKKDHYLTNLGIINQEWNRMQVNFKRDQFTVLNDTKERKALSRVDLARNCINAYLWELIFYTVEEYKSAPVYHGWFNFPKDLYSQLFEEKNGLKYSDYQASLEEWVFPGSEKVNLEILRKSYAEKEVDFQDKDGEYYAEIGERKKKKMNILFPKNVTKIEDFLTDSTTYATFSPPGCYNQSSPRKTHLHRLAKLSSVTLNQTISNNANQDSLSELVLRFETSKDTTLFVIGGIDMKTLPVLSANEAKNGYQMPMGIGNYSFYSNYSAIEATNQLESPYYAFLLDEHFNWLDSHEIGIDGPLLHWDQEGKLHLWILSFERHSFVGHYLLTT